MAPDRRFIVYLVIGLSCVNVFAAAVALWFFDEVRQSEEQNVRVRASTFARLISKDIGNQYTLIDLSLRVVAEEHADQLAGGRDRFEGWIARVASRHPAVNFIRITDADGEVIYSPADADRMRANVADRAYFIRLRDQSQAGLQITEPLIGRTTGQAVVVLARRLADRHRRFNGVVLASIPVDTFGSMLGQLLADPQSEIGLIDSRFRWLAGHPAMPTSGESGTQPLVDALRHAVEASPDHGSFIMPVAGIGHLVAYARSATYGFYTVVRQPGLGQLAAWRQKVWAGTAAMALFTLLSVALGWLLSRSWKQQSATTAKLLEREEWVRQAQQVGGLALFSYDVKNGIFAVSEALYGITGTDASYPHTWPGWLALVHPDDRQALDGSFASILAGAPDAPIAEYRVVRPVDGAVRWVKSFAHAVATAEGKIQTIAGAVVDITQQKHDEAALRKSEELFRGIFENSTVGIATTSPDKGCLTVNQRLCDVLGYERDELLQMTWADVTHPDDLDANVELCKRVLAGEIDAYEMEARYVRKNGEIIDVYVAPRAIRSADGSIDHFIVLVQDITPRKRGEARLRQSEEQLRVAFEQAAVGIAFIAPDGSWLSVNERLCEMVAYPREELLCRRFQEITHPDDVADDVVQIERLLAHEVERYNKEKRYIRRDGRILWVNVTVSLVTNDDGTPKHLVVIIEDIDARVKAERDSHQYRELMRDFLDHLPGLACIKDQEQRVVHANRGLQELLQLDNEQIIGRPNCEVFSGAFGEKIDACDKRVLASGETEVMELSYGSIVYRTTKFAIPQDDGTVLVGGIALDITRRHQLEERIGALLEINELGRSLPEKEFLARSVEMAEKLTGSTVAFLHFVNDDQETIQLSTWTTGALKGCSAIFDSHYPISQAGIWADCCREKRAVSFNDYAAYGAKRGLPDGHAQLQRLISVPVIEQGMVRMIVGVGNKSVPYDDFDVETVQLLSNDVWTTVRRARAEEALSRRLVEVTQLKEYLEEAHLQLLQSEKMSAIGQLAAGVAHELNNPIGFVYSNLGTLAEYVDDLLAIDAAHSRAAELRPVAGGAVDEVSRLKAERDHDYLVEDLPKLIRESKEGLERVRRIVLDLKDFSRVGEAEWQWTELEKGLDSTINIVWNELKYKAEVERHYGVLPPIRCLASQLNQVFMNLLVNAAQAIETRGKIAIRTGTGSDADGAVVGVWVEIEDSGRGMSPEVQKRLFEPFFTTKEVGTGTGLGLSISFSIIEKHHGRIEFESAVGRGTTFRIRLPIDGSQTDGSTTA